MGKKGVKGKRPSVVCYLQCMSELGMVSLHLNPFFGGDFGESSSPILLKVTQMRGDGNRITVVIFPVIHNQ